MERADAHPQIGLRRYGKFTDAFIDFGERVAGFADLHIVYGPNEAGKSTAMSACADLIFGIPAQSKFNFLHPYAAMRIEAEVETSGGIRRFCRIKRPHNSLLDEAENPVPDTLLPGELGGLDRSLPHHVLSRRRDSRGGWGKHPRQQRRSRSSAVFCNRRSGRSQRPSLSVLVPNPFAGDLTLNDSQRGGLVSGDREAHRFAGRGPQTNFTLTRVSQVTVPIVVASILVLAVGGWTTTVGAWYRDLRKPSWSPPDWVFGPAWTAILALAAWSGVSAWENAIDDGSGRILILALFGINIVLYMLWSPLFFAVRRPDWALAEIPFLWLSIVALMLAVGRYSSLAVWLLLPYLLWVTFAAFLNLKIVRLNRPFGERA